MICYEPAESAKVGDVVWVYVEFKPHDRRLSFWLPVEILGANTRRHDGIPEWEVAPLGDSVVLLVRKDLCMVKRP